MPKAGSSSLNGLKIANNQCPYPKNLRNLRSRSLRSEGEEEDMAKKGKKSPRKSPKTSPKVEKGKDEQKGSEQQLPEKETKEVDTNQNEGMEEGTSDGGELSDGSLNEEESPRGRDKDRRGGRVAALASQYQSRSRSDKSSESRKRKAETEDKSAKKSRGTTPPPVDLAKILAENAQAMRESTVQSARMQETCDGLRKIDWVELKKDMERIRNLEVQSKKIEATMMNNEKRLLKLEEKTMAREDVEVLVQDLISKEMKTSMKSPRSPRGGLTAGKQGRTWAQRTSMNQYPVLGQRDMKSLADPPRRAAAPRTRPKRPFEKDYTKLYELTTKEAERDGIKVTIRYEVAEEDVTNLTGMALMIRNIPVEDAENTRPGRESILEKGLARLQQLDETVTKEELASARRMNPSRTSFRPNRQGPEPVVVYFKEAERVQGLKAKFFKNPQLYRDIRIYAERECKKHMEFMRAEVDRLDIVEEHMHHWIEFNRDRNMAVRIVSEQKIDVNGKLFEDKRIKIMTSSPPKFAGDLDLMEEEETVTTGLVASNQPSQTTAQQPEGTT